MEADFSQKELLTEIEKQGVDFVYFVDISHLSYNQSKGYSTAIIFGIALSNCFQCVVQCPWTKKYINEKAYSQNKV